MSPKTLVSLAELCVKKLHPQAPHRPKNGTTCGNKETFKKHEFVILAAQKRNIFLCQQPRCFYYTFLNINKTGTNFVNNAAQWLSALLTGPCLLAFAHIYTRGAKIYVQKDIGLKFLWNLLHTTPIQRSLHRMKLQERAYVETYARSWERTDCLLNGRIKLLRPTQASPTHQALKPEGGAMFCHATGCP